MYCTYRGGFAPRIGTVQNTQGPSEFLTLPQFIPTFEPQPLVCHTLSMQPQGYIIETNVLTPASHPATLPLHPCLSPKGGECFLLGNGRFWGGPYPFCGKPSPFSHQKSFSQVRGRLQNGPKICDCGSFYPFKMTVSERRAIIQK